MDEPIDLSTVLIVIAILASQITILFFSIMLHEIAHGYTALKLGDPTAKNMGRLTLNPVKHVDPMGSLVFGITLVLTLLRVLPIVFGWAKPVMVDPRYFKNPQKGMALVAASGPLTNLAIAAAFLYIYFFLDWIPVLIPGLIGEILIFGIFLNLLFAGLNLLPIPPLDGSNILAGFLPWRFTIYFYRLRYIGMAILMILIFSVIDEYELPNLYSNFKIVIQHLSGH